MSLQEKSTQWGSSLPDQAGNYQLGLNLVDYLVKGTRDNAVLKDALLNQAEIYIAGAEIDKNGMAKIFISERRLMPNHARRDSLSPGAAV